MCLDALGRPQLPQRQLHGARPAPAPVFVRHFRGESEARALALPLGDSTAASLLVPAEPPAPLLSFVTDVMSPRSGSRAVCIQEPGSGRSLRRVVFTKISWPVVQTEAE